MKIKALYVLGIVQAIFIALGQCVGEIDNVPENPKYIYNDQGNFTSIMVRDSTNVEGYCICPNYARGYVRSSNKLGPSCSKVPECPTDKPAVEFDIVVHDVQLCDKVTDFVTFGKIPDGYVYIDYVAQQGKDFNSKPCQSKNIFYPSAKERCEIMYNQHITLLACPPDGYEKLLDILIYAKKAIKDEFIARGVLELEPSLQSKKTIYEIKYRQEYDPESKGPDHVDFPLAKVGLTIKQFKVEPLTCGASPTCPEGASGPSGRPYNKCGKNGKPRKCKKPGTLEISFHSITFCSKKVHVPDNGNFNYFFKANLRYNVGGRLQLTPYCEDRFLGESKLFKLKQGTCTVNLGTHLKFMDYCLKSGPRKRSFALYIRLSKAI